MQQSAIPSSFSSRTPTSRPTLCVRSWRAPWDRAPPLRPTPCTAVAHSGRLPRPHPIAPPVCASWTLLRAKPQIHGQKTWRPWPVGHPRPMPSTCLAHVWRVPRLRDASDKTRTDMASCGAEFVSGAAAPNDSSGYGVMCGARAQCPGDVSLPGAPLARRRRGLFPFCSRPLVARSCTSLDIR